MSDRAKLVDGKVIPVEDLLEWARWYETADRRVRFTLLNRRRKIYVSTIFLGLDHGFGGMFNGKGRQLWFETMVFGSSIDQAQDRYETLREAELGHERMVARARQARWVKNPTGNRRVWRKRFRRDMNRLRKRRRR